jgi:hypothetical protein
MLKLQAENLISEIIHYVYIDILITTLKSRERLPFCMSINGVKAT